MPYRGCVRPNCYEYCNGYVELFLENKDGLLVGKTKIDTNDLPFVLLHRWSLDVVGYANASHRKNWVKYHYRLHQYLIGKKKGFEIDHINGERLDNRRCNLRHVTRTQNCMNQRKVLGVILNRHKNYNTWSPRIKVNGKLLHLGTYMTKEEAIAVRVAAEKKYFGQFSCDINDRVFKKRSTYPNRT